MSRVVRISDQHYEMAQRVAAETKRTLQATLELAVEGLLKPAVPVQPTTGLERAPERPEAIQELVDRGVLSRGIPAQGLRRREIWDEHDQRRDESED